MMGEALYSVATDQIVLSLILVVLDTERADRTVTDAVNTADHNALADGCSWREMGMKQLPKGIRVLTEPLSTKTLSAMALEFVRS